MTGAATMERGLEKMTPILETERLILRPIREEDTNAIFVCWMRDEEVSRYMLWKASDDLEDTQEFVRFELQNLDNPKWNRWIIVRRDSADIVGTCLMFYNEEEQHWDVSYNLGRKYWGCGYITEAMSRVMQYARTSGIKECATTHAAENLASGRVLEKIGFRYEREIPYVYSQGECKTTGRYYRWTSE
jgi:ribosomal-protein-alanine N-acetyltransferase